MATRFTALQDFACEELKSHYCKGLSYTCRDGKAYDKLRALLPKWVAEGRVVLGGVGAEVTGG